MEIRSLKLAPSQHRPLTPALLLALIATAPAASAQVFARAEIPDWDRDGLEDHRDSCPFVRYGPAFAWGRCGPMDLDPANDLDPECRARERVASLMLRNGRFATRIAFAVVKNGTVHFADAFEYVGQGRFVHDPAGIHRLYRVGSTSKAMTAVAAKILEEHHILSLGDFVNDVDATRGTGVGQRTLRHLLSHDGAFKTDYGAIHLFCYGGDLGTFWRDPDDRVSPRYGGPPYGNLGGGYQYSAFNYSLAGAYLTTRTGVPFAQILQALVFDAAGMCTATLDGGRAARTPVGGGYGISQAAVMHVGPTINLVAKSDPRCEDNFYSSADLPTDPYSWQAYHLDEVAAQARDPAGGVIASVVDLGWFAVALLDSYRKPGGLVSPSGIRELWAARTDLGCGANCAYERYYGIGFFTDSLPNAPVNQVGHGGSRPGYASAFVLRPERNVAVSILANADVSTVAMSDVAKQILDDFK